jgi:hypothetical protein
MSYITVEVQIEAGQITAREPDKLPEKATGLLTILAGPEKLHSAIPRRKVHLPLIEGNVQRQINPTKEQLDESLWEN